MANEMTPEMMEQILGMAGLQGQQGLLQRKMAEAQALRGAQVGAPNVLSALAALGQNIQGHLKGKKYDEDYEKNENELARRRGLFLGGVLGSQGGEQMPPEALAQAQASRPQEVSGDLPSDAPMSFGGNFRLKSRFF